jgi:hypothetical protein
MIRHGRPSIHVLPVASEGSSEVHRGSKQQPTHLPLLLCIKVRHQGALNLIPERLDASYSHPAFAGQLNPDSARVLWVAKAFHKTKSGKPRHRFRGGWGADTQDAREFPHADGLVARKDLKHLLLPGEEVQVSQLGVQVYSMQPRSLGQSPAKAVFGGMLRVVVQGAHVTGVQHSRWLNSSRRSQWPVPGEVTGLRGDQCAGMCVPALCKSIFGLMDIEPTA